MVVIALVVIAAGAAFAVSITTPGDNPFLVPAADANGTPAFFDVVATGLPAGQAFVQECDGVPSSAPNYTANDHCDSATGNTPVLVVNGVASFLASDTTHRLRANKLRGESPQQKFNCISPHQAPI